ncbi:MAG: FG-GAP repeat domain-containing protein, partial [Planctomycetaceae bacterium]
MACTAPSPMGIATSRFLLLSGLLWSGGCNPAIEQEEFARPRFKTSPTANQEASWLSEVSAEAGLDFSREEEPEGSYFMPEIMGSGGGFLDFDSDGLLDIVLLDALWGGGGSNTRSRVRLYRQFSPGKFQEVSPRAGFNEFPSYAVGLAIGDYDSDGDSDLFVSGLGPDAQHQVLVVPSAVAWELHASRCALCVHVYAQCVGRVWVVCVSCV